MDLGINEWVLQIAKNYIKISMTWTLTSCFILLTIIENLNILSHDSTCSLIVLCNFLLSVQEGCLSCEFSNLYVLTS